jgi:hypothetical protein
MRARKRSASAASGRSRTSDAAFVEKSGKEGFVY